MNSDWMTENRKWNYGIALGVFLISFIIYSMTVAPTTSFWDCGEFIACSHILGVVHPPGSPLYLIIGKIMTLLPLFKDVGLRVNIFSVLVSAATVLLTYLVVVQLIRRWRGEPKSWEDRIIAYASGLFGALAFTFTDSFWFNAVEAEVYAFSMFFTALVIWLALHWGEQSEKAGSLLFIFFIFYLFGLAAGVHLLNILAFPFVLMIAYFHHNTTVRRLLLLLAIQAGVPILLYFVFFSYNPASMQSHSALVAHQAKAGNFLKWFGLIWVTASLIYIFMKDRKVFNSWWVIVFLLALSYTAYLLIFIRAGLKPPINENDPSTFKQMQYYLSRKQYGEESMLLTFLHRKADFWNYQIQKMFTRYFGWQFIGKGTTLDYRDRIVEIISFRGLYGLPFLVGLWGAVHHFFKDWKRALAVLILFFVMGYAIIIYLNQPDPQPRERDYSYVGAFFAFALWIGIGLAGVFEWVSEALRNREKLKYMVFAAAGILLFIAVPVNLLAVNYESHDRSDNYVAWDYSYNILQSCEPDAIVFTNGDNDTFPLWYLQEVEGIRKDVRVVNLSLLNTNWYIKQLRDQEPKIPIRLTDETIDQLYPSAWKTREIQIPVPDDVVQRLKKELDESFASRVSDRISFTMRPTIRGGGGEGIKVQDLMILRILHMVQWKRPVYFAVTVSNENKIDLDPFLRMDGLVQKVMPYRINREIVPDILEKNLLEVYQYRGLNDPKVHFPLTHIKLMQNYRSAFQQLADYYIRNHKNEDALRVLNAMDEKIPKEVIPYASELGAVLMYDMLRHLGKEDDFQNYTKAIIQGRRISRQEKMNLASYYLRIPGGEERAESFLLEIIENNADDVEAASYLVSLYERAGQPDRAIGLLENWLARHPMDGNAKKELESMRKRIASDSLALN